ncbi:hypothetical protein XHV734_3282 [Xanthomonas hortorum pv. vitians]|nr:hypothetical protein XHV734_3282 [Xanthomonas hortorum pv. vitians]
MQPGGRRQWRADRRGLCVSGGGGQQQAQADKAGCGLHSSVPRRWMTAQGRCLPACRRNSPCAPRPAVPRTQHAPDLERHHYHSFVCKLKRGRKHGWNWLCAGALGLRDRFETWAYRRARIAVFRGN